MKKEDITLRVLTFLKKAILLQQELYKTYHELTTEGNGEQSEYFARAAFEIGIGVGELENLFNSLGHKLPWQKFFRE